MAKDTMSWDAGRLLIGNPFNMCGGGKPRGPESAENPSLREEANRGDVPDKEAPHRVKTRRGVEAPRAVANRRPLRLFFFCFVCLEWEPSPSNRYLQIKFPLQGGDWRRQWAPSSILEESAM